MFNVRFRGALRYRPTDRHVQNAGGVKAFRLRQQRAGRSSGLPGPSTPVGAERGCATNVLSPSIGPHHRRACLPLLAARAGATLVGIQDRRFGVPSLAWTRVAIPPSTQLRR